MTLSEGKRKERDLFSVKAKVDPSKTNKKRKKQNKIGEAVKKRQKTDNFSTVDIQPLTYETLVEGQVILGRVSQVHEYTLHISLPHKLRGTVTIARISNAYNILLTKVKENEDDCEETVHTLQELFKPGQYVVTRVVSVENVNNKFKVNLSLAPQEVNSGISTSHLRIGYVLPCAVSSVEDNGYVMDMGIPNVRGAFLRNTATDGSGIVGVGSVVRCVITKIMRSEDESNMRFKLSAEAKAVSNATLDITDTINLSLLLPGTAVVTSISKIEKEGLYLIAAGCDGVVHRLHLEQPLDRLKQYKMAQKVRARVLYIAPLTKVVHFTLQKETCNAIPETDPLHGIKIGDTIKNAEIYESNRSGIYVKIGEQCRGFCSGNRLTDKEKPPEHVARDFPVESRQICRVIQYDYMDQLFIVSLRKSVLEQQFVKYSEIQVGGVLKATIKGYNAHGAQVAVSKLVTGFVPFLHLTDTHMKNPEKKFPVGETVKARVVKVNPERQYLLLTCKKYLVESKESIVTEYTKDAENMITEGCIVKVTSAGLLIAMYNDVKGFAPKSCLSTEPIENVEKLFSEGQVVKCRILTVAPENKKITLSLIIDGNNPFGKKKGKQMKLVSQVQMREKVNCIVKEIKEDSIKVNLQPKGIEAEIPVNHLSDDTNKSRLIKELLHEGDEIHNAVVFKKDVTTITLTLKYSVYHWVCAGGGSHSNSEFLINNSYPAAILEVRTYGLMTSIPVGNHGRSVLIHATNLTDSSKWLDCTNLGISVGQSISVVHKGEDRNGRPILSSSLKTNLKNVTQSSIQLLHSYLRDEDMIINRWSVSCGTKGLLAKFKTGDKIKARVTAITPLGLVVTVNQGKVIGILSQDHQDINTNTEVGQEILVCVLRINQEEECLELTARSDILKCLHVRETNKIKVEMKAKCEVLLARKNFILVMLKTRCVGRVAYMPSLRHTNDFKGRHSFYTVGKNYRVVIKYIDGPHILGVLNHHDKKEDLNILSERPSVIFNTSTDALVEKVEHMEVESGNLEEMALCKIQRIRTVSQCSTDSIESITSGSNSKDKDAVTVKIINKEKLKKLITDSAPQYDEETLNENQKKRRLEKRHLRLLEKKKKVEDGVEEINETIDIEEANGVTSPDTSCALEDPCNKENIQDESIAKKAKRKQLKKDKKASKKARKTQAKVDLTEDSCLALGTGFVWEVPDTAGDMGKECSESEDEVDVKGKKTKKLTKAEQQILARQEEKLLHELELARLEKDRLPESALDYEELLQRSPNSSALWIQFISFHLESVEIDKAKAVAHRALQVIDIREEEERLNIWTVLLRLEVSYGTPESVAETYREALATNDQLKVHMAMAMVYAESNKLKEAEKVYFIMTKKFSQNRDVWIKAGIFFFSNSMADEGRRYMDRALLSLDKSDHVELINRFGQLEFRFGEAERGRTIFESLLSNYPKRIDIWSVYVDILAKKEDIEGARHVLERMTGLKLRLRKMRSIFKKFLDFEKEHGSPQSVEAVRKRVEEFVTSALHQDV
nr:protein RRP5 homolog [Procambarus clarkii]